MIKIKLPILNQEFDGEKITSLIEEKNFILNVSALAQEIWEREFPEQAKNEALFDYLSRIKAQPNNSSKVISMLKILYCFIQSEEGMTKEEWLSLFNLSDINYITELVNRIAKVFNAIYPDSQKNF